MAFTSAQIAKLNKMNKASQLVSLGTIVSGLVDSVATLETGTVVKTSASVISAAQANASAVVLNTGLSTITGFTAQILRSGSAVNYVYASSASAGGNITVTSSSPASYKMAATTDVVSVVAW